MEGPDLLTEELDLVRNMNLAVEEERYNDAGNKNIEYNLPTKIKIIESAFFVQLYIFVSS